METVKTKSVRRVLLLSTDTGEGHNAAARAMAEYLEMRGIAADVRDGLAFVSRGYTRFLSRGHSLVYRVAPKLFDVGWRFCERHPRMFERGSGIFRKLASGVDRLSEAVRAGEYDAVIATHGLTAVMLTEMQRRYHLPVRTAFVATDHAGYPCMHMTDLDVYLLPDEGLFDVYERAGIPRERMRVGGIPVRRAFLENLDRAAARREIGMDESARHLVVMGGSMGCGHMAHIVSRVCKSESAGANAAVMITITVICGRNKRLYRQLSRRYRGDTRVRVLGYCDCVPLYMAASDVFLTKPGGISTAEATTAALPMVLVNTVAGCEQYNLDYYLRVGGAVTAGRPADLSALCLSLLTDDERRRTLTASLREAAPPDGAAVLWEALAEREEEFVSQGGVV